jgi:hypothetical protein
MELLDATELDLVWAGPTSFGHQLCMIDSVGDEVSGDFCSYDGEYWGFFLRSGEDWEYMPVGFDGEGGCWNGDLESFDGNYCTAENHLVGFRYGEFGEEPAEASYEDVCRPLQLKRIRTYIDDWRQNADEEGGIITAEQGSTLRFILDLRNDYPFGELEYDDIEVKFTMDEAYEGDDLEALESLDELAEETKEEVDIELDLPDDIEPGQYDATMFVSGESTQGIVQEFFVDFTLRVSEADEDIEPALESVAGSATTEFDAPAEEPESEGRAEEEPEATLLEESEEPEAEVTNDSDETSSDRLNIHQKPQTTAEGETFLQKHGKMIVLGVLELTLVLVTILVIVVIRK